jgi:hypothetical protein
MNKKFDALSNFQIDNYFKYQPEFMGCFAKDSLPKLITPNKFYIVNLQDYNETGSHWVLIASTNKAVLYLDPFGVVPPLEALEFMKTSKKPIYYSTTILQNIKSSLCGYYCIYFIEQISANRKFLDIVTNDFTNNQMSNDKVIMKYFKNVKF